MFDQGTGQINPWDLLAPLGGSKDSGAGDKEMSPPPAGGGGSGGGGGDGKGFDLGKVIELIGGLII